MTRRYTRARFTLGECGVVAFFTLSAVLPIVGGVWQATH